MAKSTKTGWLWIGLLGAAACGDGSADGIAGAAGAPPQLSMPSVMAGSSAEIAPINQGSAGMGPVGRGVSPSSAGSPGAAMGGSGSTAGATAMAGTTGAIGGPAAGDDGVQMPGPGGFPRDEAVDTNQMGPYAFESYEEGLDEPAYASSIMFYPTDAPPPYAAVAFSPGFTATKEQYMEFLGPLLASHGIAILLTTPTTTGDLPAQRGDDLQAALMAIARENTREGSPLKGKLATDRMCVTGHSMGGGGTLWAAAELGDMIRCAVPLQPWQPGQSFSQIVAPTMFIAAQSDTIAGVASNASLFYDSIPDTTPKYYVEFAGASHFLTSNTRGSNYEGQSKYMIAFYKVYLEDDMRYLDVLNAAAASELSDYRHTP